MNEPTHTQVEAFPELVSPPAPATPGKRHNLVLINKLLAGYGLAIGRKSQKVKSVPSVASQSAAGRFITGVLSFKEV